ncbi:MAG: 23S rRNA (uracil(1939)-C(5))-methyltransferase RlmD [Myxococcota bacterium]
MTSSAARIEGHVRAVGRGGDAIVETHEGVVIVPGALPGERVHLTRIGAKRGAPRGRLAEVVAPAKGRRVPACPHVRACGGCPLMIAEPQLQHALKRDFLEDACKGLPGADQTPVTFRPSPIEVGYRRRARLSWQRDRLGYRARGSKRVEDVPECVVLETSLQQAWRETRTHLAGVLEGEGEVQLGRSREGVVVAIRTRNAQPPRAFEACGQLAEAPDVAGVQLSVGEGSPAVWGTDTLWVAGGDDTALEARADAFFQANERVNEQLVAEILALSEPSGARILELHAGIGNFTVPLARRAARLVAVEQNPGAARACRRNLAAEGLRARVVEGDANAPPSGRYDVVVLDPPRQGARALFQRGEGWQSAKRIVYVSCDTATLRRDLQLACASGFRVDHAMAFDMFPQTAHVESVVRLVRR